MVVQLNSTDIYILNATHLMFYYFELGLNKIWKKYKIYIKYLLHYSILHFDL